MAEQQTTKGRVQIEVSETFGGDKRPKAQKTFEILGRHMTTIASHMVPKPSKTSVSRTIAGSAILLDAADDSIHRLNSVGTFLWQKIVEGRHSVAELIDQVIAAFEVERDQAESDVIGFLGDLLARGFIQMSV